ncbi:hypothetical protein OHT52_21155 [Streptomyces sp. NBC_00247]|uniref:hypothetical protein n=1 Tax=Streptomyces sp. NBC_00247 TaxID=2975689 RepID=UPI002E2BE2FF|nr:hypothetical protein [Streptomyces sp. NBC_00247]
MRVHLTDGTRQVDIRTDSGERVTLDRLEASALRLFAALDHEPAADEQRTPIGFTPQLTLDGVSLDSAIERSDQDDEQYVDPEDDRA